jgi:hypothetical protein
LRLVPFAVFIVVPFMELLLPVALNWGERGNGELTGDGAIGRSPQRRERNKK